MVERTLNGHKIDTEETYGGWIATEANYDHDPTEPPSHPVGQGKTEQAAIDSLLAQLPLLPLDVK